MARWLLGSEPESVFASGACLVDPQIGAEGDIDTATVIMQTAGGAYCQITNSRRCSYGYDQRIEVFGAGGMLRAGNATATRVQVASADGFLSEPALPFFLKRYEQAYRLEIDDFLCALHGLPHTLADGNDGLQALLLADTAVRSHAARALLAVTE
jgi:myo-inositol 2-dehydrogenase/D-chiro-inositol 1-dehydrogenase